MAIPGINANAPQMPSFVNQAIETLKGQGNAEKTKEVVQDVIAVLGGVVNLSVQNKAAPAMQQEVKTTDGATGAPALDNPGDQAAAEANLEALLAYLKLENDEKQAEMAKGRVETQKGELEKRHGEQVEKLKDSFKQMEKAAKASLFTKIFGWLAAALAVVIAIVAVATTGGAAIGAVVGAAIALGMAIANETGAMEDLTEKLTEALKKCGLSERAAAILAAVTIAVATIVLSFGAGGIANAVSSGVKAALSSVMKAVEFAMSAMQQTLGVAALGVGAWSTVEGYKAGMAQAEVSDMDKFLAVMRQQLEESQEELNAILEQIQNSIAGLIEILDSETDTQLEIAQQMGAMA